MVDRLQTDYPYRIGPQYQQLLPIIPLNDGESAYAYFRRLHSENGPVLERIQELESAGVPDDELATFFDEPGEKPYEDDDPNALVHRFTGIAANFEGMTTTDHKQEFQFDPEFFHPSLEKVQLMRVFHNRQIDGVLNPPQAMKTAAEYRAYFEQFDPQILKLLFKHTRAIELSNRCNAPCFVDCIAGAMPGTANHMPFEIVKEVIEDNKDDFEYTPMMYYASDLQSYRSKDEHNIDIDGVDVIAFVNSTLRRNAYPTFSYKRHTKFFELIYKLVIEHEITGGRISRLRSGQKQYSAEELLSKFPDAQLEDKSEFDDGDYLICSLDKMSKERRGTELTQDERSAIKKMFECGGKDHMNTTMGNAVKSDTLESEMSTYMVTCFHGVVLTDRGFFAHVLMPGSAFAPFQRIMWPIRPDSEILFPQATFLEDVQTFHGGFKIIMEPIFIRANNDTGEVINNENAKKVQKYIVQLNAANAGKNSFANIEAVQKYSEYESLIKQAFGMCWLNSSQVGDRELISILDKRHELCSQCDSEDTQRVLSVDSIIIDRILSPMLEALEIIEDRIIHLKELFSAEGIEQIIQDHPEKDFHPTFSHLTEYFKEKPDVDEEAAIINTIKFYFDVYQSLRNAYDIVMKLPCESPINEFFNNLPEEIKNHPYFQCKNNIDTESN